MEQLNDDSLGPSAEGSLSFRDELARIQSTSAYMQRLLDDLLGLTRAQAGASAEIKRESMDLVALAEHVVAEFLEGAEQQRIQIVTNEATMFGSWDPWQLERCYDNLFEQRREVQPDGGDISVRFDREHTRCGEFVLFPWPTTV